MRTKNYLAMLAAVLAMAATSACGGGETAAAETALPADSDEESALSLLTDVATTQYFTDEAVAEEDVDTILGAGINAPSALNGQNWHFSAITDKEVLEQIASDMGAGTAAGTGASDSGALSKAGIADAPLAIVISCASGSEFDAGLACQAMSSAAILLGYGTKIVSSPTAALNGSRQDYYRGLLGIPTDYSAAAVLLVGYADESVDETADGYTGATSRDGAESIVTYVTPAD